mmetsp:Transcript_37365/g.88333  ORF Transcript_37365/g.88333 Transcript_37365/m.88333 type:complete len:276 (+) Transcript_37365:45-872(+)|eukprot:1240206-Rhodomonas_salina.1
MAQEFKRRTLLEALIVHGGLPNPPEDPELSVFSFPADDGETFSEWLVPKTDDQSENLYKGHRDVLETIIRSDGLVKDFREIPNSAAWVMQKIKGDLIPALMDDQELYLLLPTSARHAEEGFCMPDPDARHPNPRTYMTKDVWFEDCMDGGVYILGLDDDVLIMYVDGPGDMVYGRFRCSRQQWRDMWFTAFKEIDVKYPGLEAWTLLGQISRARSEIGIAHTRQANAFEVKDRSLVVLSTWIVENWLPQSMRQKAHAGMAAESSKILAFVSSKEP